MGEAFASSQHTQGITQLVFRNCIWLHARLKFADLRFERESLLWVIVKYCIICEDMILQITNYSDSTAKFEYREKCKCLQQAIESTSQCKYEIAQHYWLSLCVTLNNMKPISWFEFLASSFSLSKSRYKKKINDTNSRHVETIELWNRKKPQQMEGKSRVTIN